MGFLGPSKIRGSGKKDAAKDENLSKMRDFYSIAVFEHCGNYPLPHLC